MRTAMKKAQQHLSKNPTTEELMKLIQSDPEQFKNEYLLTQTRDLTLQKYLNRQMHELNISASFLIQEAFISKTYLYQVLNGERLPGRDIGLRIAFVLKLSLDETQQLLTLSGKSILYPKVRRDAAIIYCLQTGKTLEETNLFLEELEEDKLL